MGDIVTERLQKSFSELLDYGFTASMEEHLDEVAQGQLDWRALLDDFYGEFSGLLATAGEPEPAGMQPNEPTMTDIECSNCGRDMQIRTASTGVFLGCSGYALPPKERCKQTINLVLVPQESRFSLVIGIFVDGLVTWHQVNGLFAAFLWR